MRVYQFCRAEDRYMVASADLSCFQAIRYTAQCLDARCFDMFTSKEVHNGKLRIERPIIYHA